MERYLRDFMWFAAGIGVGVICFECAYWIFDPYAFGFSPPPVLPGNVG